MNDPFQTLHPPRRPWLIDAETLPPGTTMRMRMAVLAPTSKAALRIAGERARVLDHRPATGAALDEEAALLSRLDAANPVASGAERFARVADAALIAPLHVRAAAPPPSDARGFDALPGVLLPSKDERVFAVLDGAGIFGLPEILAQSGLDARCLFQGKAARDHADAAPWLVELSADNATTRRLLRAERALKHGLFLTSPVSLDGLWRHLRKFTMLADPATGRHVFFRFYDPMVFRTLIVSMAPGNIASFCTGIRAMAAMDMAGGFAVIARQDAA